MVNAQDGEGGGLRQRRGARFHGASNHGRERRAPEQQPGFAKTPQTRKPKNQKKSNSRPPRYHLASPPPRDGVTKSPSHLNLA